MERYNKKVKDKEVNEVVEHIFREGLGNVVIFKTTPTNATMKANTIVYFNSKLYFKLANGETKSIPTTDVT